MSLSVIFTRGRANFDTDLFHLAYDDPKLVAAEKVYDNKLQSGLQTKHVAVLSKDLDSALALNAIVAEQCQKLQDQGVLASFNSASNLLLPSSSQRERIAEWNSYFTPEKKEQVKKMIAGPKDSEGRGIYICDECISTRLWTKNTARLMSSPTEGFRLR